MIVHISFYYVLCNTCDWAVCWFGDPWEDNVTCPYHPGKKQVPYRNREGDPVQYLHRTIQYVGVHENAYSGI